jgi:hypothetical protein
MTQDTPKPAPISASMAAVSSSTRYAHAVIVDDAGSRTCHDGVGKRCSDARTHDRVLGTCRRTCGVQPRVRARSIARAIVTHAHRKPQVDVGDCGRGCRGEPAPAQGRGQLHALRMAGQAHRQTVVHGGRADNIDRRGGDDSDRCSPECASRRHRPMQACARSSRSGRAASRTGGGSLLVPSTAGWDPVGRCPGLLHLTERAYAGCRRGNSGSVREAGRP